ncbi:hypothetical protein FH5_02390 [Priestia endophytica]|nr:hypothetical protein FH5_02390 [Priestia endophytica]
MKEIFVILKIIMKCKKGTKSSTSFILSLHEMEEETGII